MAGSKPSISVFLSTDPAQIAARKAALTTIAQALGCLQTSGPGAGTLPSVSALVTRIADGGLLVVRASLLAEVVVQLTAAYAAMMPHEPGRAEVATALSLLGHDPEPEDGANAADAPSAA